jgi:hypothetical protein
MYYWKIEVHVLLCYEQYYNSTYMYKEKLYNDLRNGIAAIFRSYNKNCYILFLALSVSWFVKEGSLFTDRIFKSQHIRVNSV